MNGIVTGMRQRLSTFVRKPKQLSITGIKDEHHKIEKYWWVNIQDLMNELCGVVVRDSDGTLHCLPSLSMPRDFFDRYGLLYGEILGKALLTWVSTHIQSYAVDSIERPDDNERHWIYLPRDSSNSVLDLAEQGIVSVHAREEPTGVFAGDIPVVFYQLFGRDYKGNERNIRKDGSHSYVLC